MEVSGRKLDDILCESCREDGQKEIDEMNKDNQVEKYTVVPEKQIQDVIKNVSDLGKLNTELNPNSNIKNEKQKNSDEDGFSSTKTITAQTGIAKITNEQTIKQDTNQTSTSHLTTKPKILASGKSTQATFPDTETAIDKADIISIQANNQSSSETPRQRDTLALFSTSVHSSYVTENCIQQYPFIPTQVSKVADFNVKSSTEEETQWVKGIALLPDDQLVFVDFSNDKVKLVDTKQNTIGTEIKLSSSPWDITDVNNNTVAMTMPNENQIQLLSVSNKKLSQGQTIKVKGQCRGIVHIDGTFIVTYHLPAKIEIISMTGNVLKVIDKGSNGESLFVDPWYIAVSPDSTRVYISDNKKHTVTYMTLDGEVKGVYKDDGLIGPRGLTVDKLGSVYVACGYLYYIYQISGDCSQGQKVQGGRLEGWPRSITYCHKEDKLYVGCDSRIHVYQLKDIKDDSLG